MLLATRCPFCETVFRIQPGHLAARHGLVRCGHCHRNFDASGNLYEVPESGEFANAVPLGAEAAARLIGSSEPVIRAPVADGPVADDSTAQEPVVESAITNEPVAEGAITNESLAEGAITNESLAEEPFDEEPVAQRAVIHEPLAQEPVISEPLTREPFVREPAIPEPVARDFIPPEPAASESVAPAPAVSPEPPASASAIPHAPEPDFGAPSWDPWAPRGDSHIDERLLYTADRLPLGSHAPSVTPTPIDRPVEPPLAPEPHNAAEPHIAPESRIAAAPELAPQPHFTHEPQLAPQPPLAPEPQVPPEPLAARTARAPLSRAEPGGHVEPTLSAHEPSLRPIDDNEPVLPDPATTRTPRATTTASTAAPEASATAAQADDRTAAAAAASASPAFSSLDPDDGPAPFAVTREPPARTTRRRVWNIVGVLVFLVLLLVLAAQLAWWLRETVMVYWPGSQPIYSQVCRQLGCQVEAPRDIDSVQVLPSSLRQVDDAHHLELTVPLHNRSDVALAYPAIELTLLDPQNNVVIRRVLQPQDYVTPGTHIDEGLPAHSTQTMIVRLNTGNITASNFRIEIFYP